MSNLNWKYNGHTSCKAATWHGYKPVNIKASETQVMHQI